MAGNNIKGITIEIGGDTKGLEESLKDVNKRSRDVQKELKEVENALKLDPSNMELVRQKQELLTRSIAETSTKLGALKQAQAQVEQQFRNGKIGEEQYRAFQRELQSTEAELRRFETQLQSVGTEQDKLARNQKDLQTYLNATGRTVDDLASVLGTRLTNAIKDGSASADQLERALNQIGRRAGLAGQDLDEFRQTLRNIDNGSSLDQVRRDLDQIGQASNEAKGKVGELGSALGGLVAGGGIAGTVATALDMAGLETKIKISMDVPEESIGTIKEAVKSVTKYGVDGEEALEAVRRQWALNENATDAMNTKIIQGAGAIAKAYQGIDMIELVQETNEIAAGLKITNEEALALTNSLLKAGFPPEQLDTIAEYGLQMKMIGFSSAEIQAIFEKGVDTKSWNIDNLNDGVKEARITMSEFGLEVKDSTAELLKGAGLSAAKLQSWGKTVAGGGKEGAKAMSEVSAWLRTIEDDSLRNEMAIAVFGTKAEDQGDNLISIFEGIVNAQNRTIENQGELNNLVEGINSDPSVQLQQSINDILEVLTPTLLKIAEMITSVAQWMSENRTLAAVIVSVTTVLGVLIGIAMALSPIFIAITSAAAAMGVGIGAVMAPVLIAVGAIAGLIAIGVALYKNWDTVKEKAAQFGQAFVSIFEGVKNKIGAVIDAIKGFFSGLSFKLPDIKLPKLPKFSMEGKFSLTPPSVPKLKVKWNALGGIFNKPTIFNTANAGLQGVGEAGSEAILPLNAQTLAGIGKGIAEQMGGGISGQEIIVPVTLQLDGRTLAQLTVKHNGKAQYNENIMADRGRN